MGLNNLEQIAFKYQQSKKRFFERNDRFRKFENINEERRDEIKNNANLWLEKCTKDSNIRMALSLFNNLNNTNYNPHINKYNKKTKNELFDFIDNDEELMFYMFVIDPELKLLQINYEENNLQDIKKRYHEEFGLDMDSRLLKIELYYNKKFPTIVDKFERERK